MQHGHAGLLQGPTGVLLGPRRCYSWGVRWGQRMEGFRWAGLPPSVAREEAWRRERLPVSVGDHRPPTHRGSTQQSAPTVQDPNLNLDQLFHCDVSFWTKQHPHSAPLDRKFLCCVQKVAKPTWVEKTPNVCQLTILILYLDQIRSRPLLVWFCFRNNLFSSIGMKRHPTFCKEKQFDPVSFIFREHFNIYVEI